MSTTKNCTKCSDCQGAPVSSDCVELTESAAETLTEYIVTTDERLEKLEKPHGLDIKTLSTNKKLTRDEIIQVLIDEIITLKTLNCQLTARVNTCCPNTTPNVC